MPFPLTTFGELSPVATKFFAEVVDTYAKVYGEDASVISYQFHQSLQLAMMGEIGKRLFAGAANVAAVASIL